MNTNWDDLKYLLAVSRCGTLSGAADHLGSNATTVSRRVKRLEEEFGFPLLDRHGDRWEAAPSAAALLDTAERFARAIADAEHEVARRSSDLTGRVVISGFPFVTSAALAPRVADFLQRFPGLELELDNSSRPRSLALREADIALRAVEPTEGKLVKRRIATFKIGLYRRRGAAPSERWIGLRQAFDHGEVMKLGFKHLSGTPALRFHTLSELGEAIMATGLAGPLPTCVARGFPELEPLLPEDQYGENSIWLVYHESRRRDPSVEKTVEWLGEVFPSPNRCVCGQCF